MIQTEPVHFTVRGLSPKPFQALFDLSDEELEKRRARRLIADSKPGFPCRVSLRDAEPGEEVILTNFVHLDSQSPFHSTHAIYVRKGATTAAPYRDRLPEMLRSRLLSIRAFDANEQRYALSSLNQRSQEPGGIGNQTKIAFVKIEVASLDFLLASY